MCPPVSSSAGIFCEAAGSNVQESDAIVRVRGWLVVVFVLSAIATAVELVLLEHTETFWQQLPLFALIGGTLVMLGAAMRTNRLTLRTLQLVMIAFIAAGVYGTWLHYRGNVEFELEMSPALNGWELFRKAMMGATPALAPGSMGQLGLIGWLYTYRHPVLRKDRT